MTTTSPATKPKREPLPTCIGCDSEPTLVSPSEGAPYVMCEQIGCEHKGLKLSMPKWLGIHTPPAKAPLGTTYDQVSTRIIALASALQALNAAKADTGTAVAQLNAALRHGPYVPPREV